MGVTGGKITVNLKELH